MVKITGGAASSCACAAPMQSISLRVVAPIAPQKSIPMDDYAGRV